MLRRILQTSAMLTGLLMATAVQAQTPSAPFQGEGGKVRVYSFPSGNDYPFWAISKLGLDKKYGFVLENVPGQPGGAVATAFRSGATDGGLLNWLELARMRAVGDQVT